MEIWGRTLLPIFARRGSIFTLYATTYLSFRRLYRIYHPTVESRVGQVRVKARLLPRLRPHQTQTRHVIVSTQSIQIELLTEETGGVSWGSWSGAGDSVLCV